MANKDPERRARTRACIVDAYWTLYAADPSHAVTVSAVIERAGVHRSTFYEYFCDAKAVLAAIEDELAAVFEQESTAALASGGDPAEVVRRVYVMHGDKLSVLLGDAGDPSFARKLKEALRPAAERGLALCGEPADPYRFEFAASGILAAANLWYKRGQDLGPAEFGELIRSLLSSVARPANG